MDNSLEMINFLDGYKPCFIHIVYKESDGDHVALSAYYDFRSACNEVDELRKQFPYDFYGLSKVRIIDSMPF